MNFDDAPPGDVVLPRARYVLVAVLLSLDKVLP